MGVASRSLFYLFFCSGTCALFVVVRFIRRNFNHKLVFMDWRWSYSIVLEEIIISSLKHCGGNLDKRMKALFIYLFMFYMFAQDEMEIRIDDLHFIKRGLSQVKTCKQLKELPKVSQNCKIVLKWCYYPTGKECTFVL